MYFDVIFNLFKRNKERSGQIRILDKTAYAEAIALHKAKPIDVRTATEFQSGHIKSAKNIDFFNFSNFKKSFEMMDKDQPVFIYCRSGARSQKAARKLVDMGFSNIYDLKGGYISYI